MRPARGGAEFRGREICGADLAEVNREPGADEISEADLVKVNRGTAEVDS
jgi:hypothetical protein